MLVIVVHRCHSFPPLVTCIRFFWYYGSWTTWRRFLGLIQFELALCGKIFPGKMQHTCLHTPNRITITDQSHGYHQSPAWWTMSFIGVTYCVGDMLYNRSKNDSMIAESPKPTPEWVTAHKSWEPGVYLRSLLAVGGCPFLMAQF